MSKGILIVPGGRGPADRKASGVSVGCLSSIAERCDYSQKECVCVEKRDSLKGRKNPRRGLRGAERFVKLESSQL